MKNSLIILLFFIIGIICGQFDLKIPDYSLQVLYLLLFFVGISIGADKKSWSTILQMKHKILYIPIITILGTLLGVSITIFFIKTLSQKDILSIGAGFGYYSLSSIIITKVSTPLAGATALLSNIFRESLTLIFAPLIHKYFGALAPIGAGGATSMDTTLPVIIKTSGKEYVAISIFHGTFLTVIVPLIIPIIYSL